MHKNIQKSKVFFNNNVKNKNFLFINFNFAKVLTTDYTVTIIKLGGDYMKLEQVIYPFNPALEQSVYPYNTNFKELPFYLAGIGGSEYQGHITRPEGFMWHQIFFCGGGSGTLKYDDKSIIISQGDYFFIPKGYPHEYYPDTEKWDVRWAAFDGPCCGKLLEQFNMRQPIVAAARENVTAENIFDRMITSVKTDILYCDYTCSGLIYCYIIEFHRMMSADVDRKKSKQLTMLLPALQYINNNLSQDFSIAFLAKMLKITPQHFCKIFRETLNMRPNSYIITRRLEEAKRQIRENRLPIAEISHRCGFHDPGYFSTVFKKYEGISPAEYRRRITEK